jgi:hypothetical protein
VDSRGEGDVESRSNAPLLAEHAGARGSSNAHLAVGAALLCAAILVALAQAPRPSVATARPATERAGPSPGSATAPSGSAAASTDLTANPATLASLGPIRAGDAIGESWRVERIEGWSTEVRLELEHVAADRGADGGGDTKVTLGLAAPASHAEPAIVAVPDLFVWYSGHERPTPAVQALIRALVARLRGACEGRPLHECVLAWASSAPRSAGATSRDGTRR